jgi:hypothetical protein
MKEHMPWIYLLIILSIILCINIYLANEGFEISTTSFSDFLLSLITINPDSSGNTFICPTNPTTDTPESSVNTDPPESCAPPKPKPEPIEDSCNATGSADNSKCITDSSLKTLHGYLKSDIEKLIKEEKRNERNKPLTDTCTATGTTGLSQGASRNCTKPGANCDRMDPSPIDMSQYIRKDSIPCWGCSVD